MILAERDKIGVRLQECVVAVEGAFSLAVKLGFIIERLLRDGGGAHSRAKMSGEGSLLSQSSGGRLTLEPVFRGKAHSKARF
jgi:hypothetical protein